MICKKCSGGQGFAHLVLSSHCQIRVLLFTINRHWDLTHSFRQTNRYAKAKLLGLELDRSRKLVVVEISPKIIFPIYVTARRSRTNMLSLLLSQVAKSALFYVTKAKTILLKHNIHKLWWL